VTGAPVRRAAPAPGRPRDAAATRRDLLAAAQQLFGQKGYERTTIREIGQAAVRRSTMCAASARSATGASARPGSVLQALARDDASPEIRAAAAARLVRRMVEPLTAQYAAAGADRPALRAQVAVAAVLGTSLGRSLGWFEELHGADPDELAALLVSALGPTP